MGCNYPCYTWFVLVGMIFAGSFRSIVVKLAYQSGFRAPLMVTLLSFMAKSLSLLVYYVSKWMTREYNVLPSASMAMTDDESEGSEESSHSSLELGTVHASNKHGGEIERYSEEPTKQEQERHSNEQLQWYSVADFYTSALQRTYSSIDEIPNGSNHGLSRESEERIRWVHRVPFYVRPAIPAILNLLASALRWTSLVYIDASIVEMMVSGLELTLSVVAARIFRKRMVAKRRWAGVTAVAVGVIVIERANGGKGGEGDPHTTQDKMIGVILIVIQSILSVLQDLAEEIFMQSSGSSVPATMMLGIEGMYGFAVGAIIYSSANEMLRGVEDIDATIAMLRDNDNAELRWWLAGLPLIFLITGMFNIKATEVTSAMTRNVWKTLRTGLVWVIALGVYYWGNNPALGEAWHVPESFVLLFGYIMMSGGIMAYYSQLPNE